MPELTLFASPRSAPCRAVLLHHQLLVADLADESPDLFVRFVDMDAGEHKGPEVTAVNPLGCVPALSTPWGPLWESRSIMRFLESLCPEPVAYPVASFHRASVDRLLDWDLGSLYRVVSTIVYPKIFRGVEPAAEDLDKLVATIGFLDRSQLGDGRPFLTGVGPTIADISIVMTLSLLRLVDLDVDDMPNVSAWRAEMASLPAWEAVDQPFAEWVAEETTTKMGDEPRVDDSAPSANEDAEGPDAA